MLLFLLNEMEQSSLDDTVFWLLENLTSYLFICIFMKIKPYFWRLHSCTMTHWCTSMIIIVHWRTYYIFKLHIKVNISNFNYLTSSKLSEPVIRSPAQYKSLLICKQQESLLLLSLLHLVPNILYLVTLRNMIYYRSQFSRQSISTFHLVCH